MSMKKKKMLRAISVNKDVATVKPSHYSCPGDSCGNSG